MQLFGLLSLLVVIVLGSVLVIRGNYYTPIDSPDSSNEPSGLSVINDAKEAAKQIERGSVGRKITVYEGIMVSEGEAVLDVSGRNLSGSLKAEIRQLTKLEELDISNNNFTGLPAEVGQLSELRLLDLSNNPLTGLPHELGNLKKLRTLDLRGTNYSQVDLDVIKKGLPPTTDILID
jgi:Leucine-rich repeat (LRR) protein